jgi:hypothetical protein
MVVRIRFGRGRKLARNRIRNRSLAIAAGALLTPAALVASVLAVWRIAADLNVANSFAIPSGLFSHWQVWVGAAVGLQLCSRVLNRYGRGRGAAIS